MVYRYRLRCITAVFANVFDLKFWERERTSFRSRVWRGRILRQFQREFIWNGADKCMGLLRQTYHRGCLNQNGKEEGLRLEKECITAKSRFCLDWISPNIAHVREMFSVILITLPNQKSNNLRCKNNKREIKCTFHSAIKQRKMKIQGLEK